jgi:hypothetical protein
VPYSLNSLIVNLHCINPVLNTYYGVVSNKHLPKWVNEVSSPQLEYAKNIILVLILSFEPVFHNIAFHSLQLKSFLYQLVWSIFTSHCLASSSLLYFSIALIILFERLCVGRQWLTPAFLATQEAEIRKIIVQRQSRQIVPQDPILKIPNTKKGWCSGSRYSPWVQTPVPQKKERVCY